MPNIGPAEIMIVLVLALIVLGPKRLPEAGAGIGRGLREFKNAITGDGNPDDDARPTAAVTSAPAPSAEHDPAHADRAPSETAPAGASPATR